MAMHLITGHAETAHISAADAGALNACTIGAGSYVFEYGDDLKAVMTTANKVTIGTGALMHQGRQALVGTATDLTVESGTQAQKRNDLVVARYTKTGDVDDMHLAVVKGTPVSYGDPSDPVLEDGNILEGATVSEMPLWRIPLDGISVGEPEKLFETVPSIDSLRDSVSQAPCVDSGISSGTNADGVIACRLSAPAWAEGRAPDAFACTMGPMVGSPEQALLFTPVIWAFDMNFSQVQVRVRREDSHTWASNQGVSVSWVAIWNR